MTETVGKTTRDPTLPAEREDVDRHYHAAIVERADEQPSLALDQRILAAAHAEVAQARTVKRGGLRWWRRYFAPASAVVVALFGLTIAWHVMDEQELAQRQQLGSVGGPVTDDASPERPIAAQAPESQPAVSPAPSTATAEMSTTNEATVTAAKASAPVPAVAEPVPPLDRATKPRAVAPVAPVVEMRKGRFEEANASAPPQSTDAVVAPAAVAVELPAAKVAAQENAPGEAVAPRAPSSPAPMLRAVPAPSVAEVADRQNAAPSGAGATAAAPPLPQPAKKAEAQGGLRVMPEAERRDEVASARFATPEEGLRQIRAARDSGRRDEAVRLLARWHAQYAQRAIPDDLVDLLPAAAAESREN